jgi:hypothetical protein
MGTAKIISLQARPTQTTILCFDVDGILATLTAQLGDQATAFDFNGFYSTLNGAPTVSGDASRLQYDPDTIASGVASSSLASLRSEMRRVALANAISARQNAYFSKYQNINAIVSKITGWYSPSVTDSKPKRLAKLSQLSDDQATTLKTSYTNDNRLGVVKQTKSTLQSKTQSTAYGTERESGSQAGSSDQVSLAASDVAQPHALPALPASGQIAGWNFRGGGDLVETMVEGREAGTSSSSGTTTNAGSAAETQTIANTDYGYRIPYIESQAQNERAQISLIDQQFAQFMYSQPLPNLTTVFKNELSTIDGEVIKLQVAFLNCILMSPFTGTVTGIYKNAGDCVRAGEPVIRVENNSSVYLVATLVYRGRIAKGANVTVQTSLFDDTGEPTAVTGTVVAARGHTPDDDSWDVVILCNNVDGSGNEILPLNYSFDFDDTVVTIG